MIAAALAALLALALPADSVDAPCSGGQVLSRANLDAAGATHLHDVLWLADGLDAVTVDGYDAVPVAGVGLPFRQPVRVLVDGAPTASGTALEPAGMEFLPVALGEVGHVVVCPGPGVAGGAWGGPWIDVHTAPPARHAYGAVGYGNETGDPGPARYLDPTLPNVDHWGPDFEAALVARSGPSATWAALRDRGFFPTDTAIAPRVFEAVDGLFPARSGTSMAAAAALPGWRVRAGGFRGLDLPYIGEVGREIPVTRRSVQATATGVHPVGARWTATGHVHAARLWLRRPEWGALPVDPAWTETRFSTAAALSRSRGSGTVAAGVQGEGVAADGAGLVDETVSIGRLWAEAEGRRGPFTVTATVQASAAESGVAAGGALVGRGRLGPRLGARLTLAADRALPETTPDFAFWTHRGYSGLTGVGPALVAGAVPQPADRALARFDLMARLRAGLRLAAAVEGQVARGDVLREDFVLVGPAVGGQFLLVPAQGGAIRVSAAATWARPGVRLRTTGRIQGHVAGDGAYRESWRRVPRLQATLEATARPDGRLALWGRLTARTGSTWTGYPDPDVPGAVLLDLGLSKRAWGNRLRLSLSGRNVLDAPERTHPLGATLSSRLLVRLEARL